VLFRSAADLDFKRKYSLGAINSVNWARVLAQIVYYFSGAFDVCKITGAKKIRVSVPTGNFGDILAGWIAMKMGAPISQLILATNENDILARFFNTGEYSISEVFHTLSPSMDIQVASNFERYLYYRTGCNPEKLRALMETFGKTGVLRVDVGLGGTVDPDIVSDSAEKAQVLETISRYSKKYNYTLDPHTACGVAAAEQFGLSETENPVMCLATAHPAKFPEAIDQATGSAALATHPQIEAIMDLPTRCENLPNDIEVIKKFIADNTSG